MKIFVRGYPKKTLAEFCDQHGLDLQLTELEPGVWRCSFLPECYFSGKVEIPVGGRGVTQKGAIGALAESIQGKRIRLPSGGVVCPESISIDGLAEVERFRDGEGVL